MQTMTEPASTAAGGIALYKLGILAAIGSAVVAFVVMAMTTPRTTREFVVAMICTIVSSICGGAGVVRWFDLTSWMLDDIGMVAIGGIIFACGLPAWVIVRAWFNWSEARRSVPLPEMVKEFRDETGM